jgi:hypothetical protein
MRFRQASYRVDTVRQITYAESFRPHLLEINLKAHYEIALQNRFAWSLCPYGIFCTNG